MNEFKVFTESRVRFCDTDLQGVMHHGEHLRYFEVARVEYMRNLGLIEGNDFAMPATVALVEAGVKFYKPLKFDDPFRTYVRVSELKGASLNFEYKMVKTGSDEICATGFTRLAIVDKKNFKPVRMPENFRERISSFEGF